MRRTDVCHPIESRAPAPRAFPAPCAPREAWTPHGVLGSVEWGTGGPDVFTTSETASAGRRTTHVLCIRLRFRVDASAWAFSSHGAVCDRASDTPVAELLPSSASPAFAGAASWPHVPLVRRMDAGRKTEEPPRPPSFVPRERDALGTIRDAFHRQGPFVGAGGHYSPGPATTSPREAMVSPLNDGLPPFWAFRRSSPCYRGVRRATTFSLDAPTDGATRRPPLRARSLFTRPCRSFWSAYAERIRDRSSPDDFCNCLRRASYQTRARRSSQGRRP